MGGILQVDTIQNNNTSTLITQTNATTITIGTTGQTISLAGGASSSGFGATYNSGLNWTSTLVTSALTVSAGVGYFVNTSTAAITLTLPASPTFGSIVGINDYSGYASTNNITVNPNGNKLEGGTSNKLIITNKESVILNYVDSTRGWLPTSGVNNGTDALTPLSYSVDFLVIAGGGAGGGSTSGRLGGGGAGGYRTSVGTSGGGGSAESSLTFNGGVVYTITVGAGGTATTSGRGSVGVDSSISGSNITTITSAGGGGGGGSSLQAGGNGGSGGGAGDSTPGAAGGSGTANQGFGGGSSNNNPAYNAGGGGGAGAVGADGSTTVAGAGGNGLASSITGSSVTRAGGGGASFGYLNANPGASGGTGGGGAGANSGGSGTNGTANTGSGGGGGGSSTNSGAGGKGVVILSMPDASYSGTTTGSPTVSTNVSGKTVLTFNDSGSYTG
jgi:hypothetical protein